MRLTDDHVDGGGPIEVSLVEVGSDLLERAAGPADHPEAVLQGGEPHNPFGLLRLLLHVAAIVRAVDGDPLHVESVPAEERVGDRVLVVHLVVGVRIQ